MNVRDSDGAEVNPATDDLAWLKACDECAFRRHDPQDLGEGYQRSIRHARPGRSFFCIHRHDEGRERICASFAAINKLPRLDTTS